MEQESKKAQDNQEALAENYWIEPEDKKDPHFWFTVCMVVVSLLTLAGYATLHITALFSKQ